MLPDRISLISGPGCPVCVTAQGYVDTAIELARKDGVTVMTFGDMIRVPGSVSSLLAERAEGRDVKICLSASDALQFAVDHPDRKVVFLGIGFETTAPSIAASVLSAKAKKLQNYSVLCGLKTMPAALTALVSSKDVVIHGFICPGHVSAITGLSIYVNLAKKFGIPCVISGFEPNDLLLTIEMIAKQIREKRAEVENEYTRVVKPDGNPHARKILDTVFRASVATWRGLGEIPGSGLAIREEYASYDASALYEVELPAVKEPAGCICGRVMTGRNSPLDCGLFGKKCTPENPVGACMVSSEGACGIRFMYRSAKRAL